MARKRLNWRRRVKARATDNAQTVEELATRSRSDVTVRGGVVIPRMASLVLDLDDPRAVAAPGVRALRRRADDGDVAAQRYIRRTTFAASGIRGELLDYLMQEDGKADIARR